MERETLTADKIYGIIDAEIVVDSARNMLKQKYKDTKDKTGVDIGTLKRVVKATMLDRIEEEVKKAKVTLSLLNAEK